MKLADFPEIAILTPNQKIELIDELLISISKESDALEPSETEKRLLDERLAEDERNPDSALTLEQLTAMLARRQ